MKRNTEPGVNELEGCVKLGMAREALKLARRALKQTDIRAKAFNDALDAILIQSDKLKPRTRLVEDTYARLPKRDRKAVRFMLVSFRHSIRDHEGVLQLLPRHFSGESALCELSFGMDAAMALNKMELAGTLARRLPWAMRAAGDASSPQGGCDALVAFFCQRESPHAGRRRRRRRHLSATGRRSHPQNHFGIQV